MSRLADIIAEHRHREGPLLPILHDVQTAFGCVDRDAEAEIAEALNLSRAEVHGVVSFYHDFRAEADPRPLVQLCRGEACQAFRGGAGAHVLVVVEDDQRFKDKLFLRIRSEAEGGLVIFVSDLGEKEALLQSDPKKFFTTPHYDGYPAVLVNLRAIGVKELRELITESWCTRAPKRVLAAYLASQSS